MKKALLLFQSIHELIRAERICREEGLAVQVLPVPRDISSECGMVLEIDEALAGRLVAITANAGISAKIYFTKSNLASHGIERI